MIRRAIGAVRGAAYRPRVRMMTIWTGLMLWMEIIFDSFVLVPPIYLWKRVREIIRAFAEDDREPATWLKTAAHVVTSSPREHQAPALTSLLNREQPFTLQYPRPPWTSASFRASQGINEDWVNRMLQQAWPNALSQFFKSQFSAVVDRIMQEYTGSSVGSRFIKSVVVKRCEAGRAAPRILSVKVREPPINTETIHAEVSFEWQTEGFENVLEICTDTVVDMNISIAVTDVGVSGTVQCVLGPLIPAMPPCRQCTLFFMPEEKPRIDLRVALAGHPAFGGDVEMTMTLGRVLRRKLRKAFVYPRNIVVPLNTVWVQPTSAS